MSSQPPPEDEQTIVVVGRRMASGAGWVQMSGAGGATPREVPTDPGADNPQYCIDTTAYDEAQKEKLLVALEAAKVYNEVMVQSDRDHFEYGSIIYRNSAGVITHTPVRRGGPTSADFDLTGFTSDTFGDVLGVVHSHPGDRYDPSFPDRLLQPTPDASQGSGQGDPYAFQWWVDRAAQVLENRGMSAADARAQAEAQFSAFIVGGTGQAGTGSYALKAFAYGDYNNADGVLIDPTMPAC